jgi:hypothetical protein
MNSTATEMRKPSCIDTRRDSVERVSRIPSLSRNRWSRPDLARVMNTEGDYAPYISPHQNTTGINAQDAKTGRRENATPCLVIAVVRGT